MSTQTETQEMEALEGKVEATIAAVKVLVTVAARDDDTRVLLKKLLGLFQDYSQSDAFKATLDNYLKYVEMMDR